MLCEQVNRCKHNREGNDIKKEAAKENKETRKHLLECAGREFLEKGYMKASLRNICKEAGVTTGALYFFFKDKEDLFAALVEKPLKQLYLTMEEHYAAEMRSETQVVRLEQNDDDLETSREIIRQMYANRDAFLLLLTKSQGSRFENCLDEIVDISEQQYRRLCDMVTGATGRPRIDDYMTHWMAHIMVDTFMHLFLHESEERCPDQVFGPGLDGHDDGKLRYMHPEKVRTLQGCCFRILT
jgi:AcrR family transcriptional regulator